MSIHDLRDALAQPGCAICRLRDGAADDFVKSTLWESVNDPATRDKLRRAQGFCQKHAWSMVRYGSSLGAAIITRDLIEEAVKALAGAPYQRLPTLSLRRAREALNRSEPALSTAELVSRLEPQAPCPACLWAAHMEELYVKDLLHNLLGEEGLLEALGVSDGLCLPHLRQALALVRNESTFRALVEAQSTVWNRLVGELSEFIRKNDHRFLHEEMLVPERDAWLRAIAAVVGSRPESKKT